MQDTVPYLSLEAFTINGEIPYEISNLLLLIKYDTG